MISQSLRQQQRGVSRIAKRNTKLFQVEFNSPPPPPNHIILPSGVAVIGIDSWVERFEKIFQNILPDHEVRSSDPIVAHTRSQPPNVIPLHSPVVTNV